MLKIKNIIYVNIKERKNFGMNKKILIVDDDVMNLRMAEFILKQGDYAVFKEESGIDCLRFLRDIRPDLILLDIEMPVMNGFKTLEKIRENKATADIPVIFLTANADTDTVIEAGKLGVVDYVKKPFFPQELLNRVEKDLS